MTRNALWLGTSSDVSEEIPFAERMPTVIAARLSREIAQELVPVVRTPWPTPALFGLIEDWLDNFDPLVVVLHVNSFWFTYESVPGKVRRVFGPAGEVLAKAGSKAADSSAVSANPMFKLGRKALVRTIGGDLLVTPDQAIEVYREVIRTIITHEEILLLVRGPLGALDSSGTLKGYNKAESGDACTSIAL